MDELPVVRGASLAGDQLTLAIGIVGTLNADPWRTPDSHSGPTSRKPGIRQWGGGGYFESVGPLLQEVMQAFLIDRSAESLETLAERARALADSIRSEVDSLPSWEFAAVSLRPILIDFANSKKIARDHKLVRALRSRVHQASARTRAGKKQRQALRSTQLWVGKGNTRIYCARDLQQIETLTAQAGILERAVSGQQVDVRQRPWHLGDLDRLPDAIEELGRVLDSVASQLRREK